MDACINASSPEPIAPAAVISPTSGICQECGKTFAGKVSNGRAYDATFCSPRHKRDFHARNAERGRIIIPFALAWRTRRGGGATAKAAFAEMNALLDMFAAEDRAAGRPSTEEYAAALLARGRYIDRRR